jgi:hypothetical protein
LLIACAQAPCDVDICVILDIEIDQGILLAEGNEVCREPFYDHQAHRAASGAFEFTDRLLCLFGIVKRSPDVIDKKLARRVTRKERNFRSNIGAPS